MSAKKRIDRPSCRAKYSVIITAEKPGTRMVSYGPKPLVKLNKKTIFDRQQASLGAVFKHYETILVGGFQQDKLQNRLEKITHINNQRYLETNTAYSLSLALSKITTNRVVIIPSGLLFNKDSLECPLNQESSIICCPTISQDNLGVNIVNGYAEHVFYNLNNTWGHILYLTGVELAIYTYLCGLPENFNKFSFEIINQTIDRGGKFKVFHTNTTNINIETSKIFNQAKATCG